MEKRARNSFSSAGCISLLIAVIISSSFHVQQKADIDISKANPGDFSWLTDFYIISQCLSLEHYEKTPGKSFDSIGVSLQGGKYHPVNLFQYGILCFDKYRQTGDEQYKKKCLAQFSYFLDTSHFVTKADGSIGFPYNITFRDLKPVWFSGLAQSEGIMYLIRYYYLTKDKRALELIKRTYNFMMIPLSENGTFNAISDSEAWIEEYPNSKTKPEVLNGFVTAIMGLREYCYMFPEDVKANETLQKCISTHKKWLHKYDYGSGVLYDLGEKQKVGAWYMKFQVIQMKHMFDLYKDTLYKNLEMLWATYAYNKPIPGMFGCLLTDTNFSMPGKMIAQDQYGPEMYTSFVLKPDKVGNVRTEGMKELRNGHLLYDGDLTSTINILPDSTLGGYFSLYFKLKSKITATNLVISGSGIDSAMQEEIVLYSRADSSSKWKEFKIESMSFSGKAIRYKLKERQLTELRVFFRRAGQKVISLGEINFEEKSEKQVSCFTHFYTPEFSISGSNNIFQVKKNNVDDFVIFYKSAKSTNELNSAKWNIYEGIRKEIFEVGSEEKICKFLVVFKNISGNSWVKLVRQNS